MKKEKEIWASSAGAPQSAQVTATGHDKCFTEMERALNLHSKMSSERPRSHCYCCNCPILLLAAVHILLCLISKINFITGMDT